MKIFDKKTSGRNTPGSKTNNHLPPLGAHTSIAGGFQNALYAGKEIGCDVIQIFSKNQMQWKSKSISPQDIENFLGAKAATNVDPVTIHDAYLINLGSPDDSTYQKSVDAFVDELQRCEQLKIPYLVMHPGSHLGSGEETGLRKISNSIKLAFEKAKISNTIVLLETTAGQGTNLGYQFEHLNFIITESGLGKNIGICLDTCHIFAAGYDIRTWDAWKKTKQLFSEIIGLNYLKTIHLNDSKKKINSRVDRHERIGKGNIGLNGFRSLINDQDLKKIPMILEVPGGEPAYAEDIKILRDLKVE